MQGWTRGSAGDDPPIPVHQAGRWWEALAHCRPPTMSEAELAGTPCRAGARPQGLACRSAALRSWAHKAAWDWRSGEQSLGASCTAVQRVCSRRTWSCGSARLIKAARLACACSGCVILHLFEAFFDGIPALTTGDGPETHRQSSSPSIIIIHLISSWLAVYGG
jgi:hypothetical protein